MCKQKEFPHSKLSLTPVWNMETTYGALSYQTSTSKNCKPFKTQLCESLLAAHETQTPTRQNPNFSNGYPSQTSCHSTSATDSNKNTPFT